MRRRHLLVLLALAAACGGGKPIPDVGPTLRVTAGAEEVELGKAFPLEVVRVFPKERAPAEFRDDVLAPLEVRLVETTRREDDRRVEETRSYLGYAFSLDDVTVPIPGAPLTLRVRRALDPAAPGPPELPGGPLVEPFSRLLLPVLGVLALAGLALLVRSRRRARRVESADEPAALPAAPPPPPSPHDRALERIDRLRRLSPRGSEEIQAYHVETSGLTRDYLVERFAVPAGEMTTEECLSAPRTARRLTASHLDRLAEVLGPCDLVKFARHLPSAEACGRMLDTAEMFVRETSP